MVSICMDYHGNQQAAMFDPDGAAHIEAEIVALRAGIITRSSPFLYGSAKAIEVRQAPRRLTVYVYVYIYVTLILGYSCLYNINIFDQ